MLQKQRVSVENKVLSDRLYYMQFKMVAAAEAKIAN